ncbi:hypothetical protein [Pseudarthrobacter albicanus]|uniref:hypothetical protein n=1 Tax=Pseudarthrobacter albicanus TaxID=2823873 RepID=UPI001BAB34F0|nr:hypothetical protein [Pseudarthrobacter albicanus]
MGFPDQGRRLSGSRSLNRLQYSTVLESSISWNYTTYLNIGFLALAAFLVARFVRNGGTGMLKMMGGSPDNHDHHHG